MSGDKPKPWWREDYTVPKDRQKAEREAQRDNPAFLARLGVLNRQRAARGHKPYTAATAPVAEVQAVSWYDVRDEMSR